MAEALQSIGVIMPHDLLPDKDFDDLYDDGIAELVEDGRDYDRYIDLALAYYNGIHHTDYKLVEEGRRCGQRECSETISIHSGFFDAPVECESAVKYFCSKLFQAEYGDKEVVTSCVIVDGLTPTGCTMCDAMSGCDFDTCRFDKEEVNGTESWEDYIPPLSQYSHVLADGVTLSDKAKFRLRFTLPALAYYNKKQHTDYKLVDVLPYCLSMGRGLVVHCNFIAKQNAADASNKLFFAELHKPNDVWVVIACRVVRGKTTAGCHRCPPNGGKRVIHPTRGYRFGLYPYRPRLHSSR